MSENYITRWHREDSYRSSQGRPIVSCQKCKHAQAKKEGVYQTIRCGLHSRTRVSPIYTCNKAEA
ncbi:hypothetical protein dsx2_2623 [Desulfovibrio sp. X2]|uniref:hypothetical protein n=1 Tax=Desulfovibrio sp. X2 TaxID=941449 RepID=UPI0003588FE3|nr:hypothetical protein [Desulfovibrio sp. X2]EPR42706.1 hypothetical protein dsx2_2623 [Desulfovibrio sp. X2]